MRFCWPIRLYERPNSFFDQMYCLTRLQYSRYSRPNTSRRCFSSARTIRWWTAMTNTPEQDDERVCGVQCGCSNGQVHPNVHRVPAHTEQPVRPEAGVFSGCPEAEGIPHREPPEIHERKPAYPEQQRDELEGPGTSTMDILMPQLCSHHCSPEHKDGILARVKQRPVNRRFPILFDLSFSRITPRRRITRSGTRQEGSLPAQPQS